MYIVDMEVLVPLAEFDTVAAARSGLKEMLDAAQAGGAGLVHRSGEAYALLSTDTLRPALRAAVGTVPEVYVEGEGVGIVLPGMPFAAEGATLAEAAADLVEALREYAVDWPRLRHAPNHRHLQTLVALVDISTDDELLAWLTGR